MVPRDHTGIVNQDRHLANLLADPLGCRVDIFSFAHITGVCVNLQVAMGQRIFFSISSCYGTETREQSGVGCGMGNKVPSCILTFKQVVEWKRQTRFPHSKTSVYFGSTTVHKDSSIYCCCHSVLGRAAGFKDAVGTPRLHEAGLRSPPRSPATRPASAPAGPLDAPAPGGLQPGAALT